MATYNNMAEELKKAAAPAQTQAATTSQQNTTAVKAPSYTGSTGKYNYNADDNAAFQQAWSALEYTKQNKPTYNNSYEAQINDVYAQIVNRDKFTYNVNEDALYRQYRDQYAQMGQLAMRDTMGQAAALTGGYGSSYGQSVGQQQYNAYLQQLNDVVPELYGMAYQQYQDQGDALLNQYGMLAQMADDEYGKYQDAVNNYYNNLNYQKSLADDAYNRGYSDWYASLDLQQNAYDNLAGLITNTGYTPSEAELAEAGMSSAQAAAYKSIYDKNNPVTTSSSGSGGGGNGSSKKTANPQPDDDDDNPTIEDLVNSIVATSTVVKNGVNNTADVGTVAGQKAITSQINKEIDAYAAAEGLTAAEKAALKQQLNPRGYTK